jgi:hypothetical protein
LKVRKKAVKIASHGQIALIHLKLKTRFRSVEIDISQIKGVDIPFTLAIQELTEQQDEKETIHAPNRKHDTDRALASARYA